MRRMIAVILCLAVIFGVLTAFADDYSVFILCNPKTPVNVRRSPKKGNNVSGRLDFGDSVMTDGEKRNGYLHVLGVTEDGEGWIFAGYVIEDEPEKMEQTRANVAASGRVMSYRWIDGKRNGWVKVGTDLRVLAISDEWAVTDRGYIRTEYLEVWHE